MSCEIRSSSQHWFGLVPLMFASSRVRENVAISLIFTSRERRLPFCKLCERCTPERPKNDQNRARCWLPQHAQQGKKKVSNIIPKCFQNRPREPQNHSPELPKSSRGAPQNSRGAPKSSRGGPNSVPGAPRSPNRAPQAPKGCPRCVQRVSEGPFGRHSGTIWASKMKSRSRC